MSRWFAVSASREIPRGHIAHTQLLGQELAVWRSASGELNAWENRCPHRGVRLTIGSCVGEELRCQYHAWRFASGSGQCTYIPAHPTQKPAATIRARAFPVREDGTFAWVNLAPEAAAAPPPDPGIARALRSMFVQAPVAELRAVLLGGYGQGSVTATDEYTLLGEPDLEFMLQPVSDRQAIVHARLRGHREGAERLAELRHHNALLSAVRDRAEAAA
ncbi:MAG TPA: Rieske (2Fe-2S) protein [Steroidobacteraceae bacterium]|nr:Rieske (2Fe-2S) protein [Steroidobacteraceae bacterium]